MSISSVEPTHPVSPNPHKKNPDFGKASLGKLDQIQKVVPESMIKWGSTGLPYLLIPVAMVDDIKVGPCLVFFNLNAKRYRIINRSDQFYEHCCGSKDDVLAELETLYDCTYMTMPDEV